MTSPKTLTTGQLGQLCGLSTNTIVNKCRQGLIEYYMIPPGRHRRITYQAAVKFLLDNKMAQLIPEDWGNNCDVHVYNPDSHPDNCQQCGRHKDYKNTNTYVVAK